MRQLAMRQVTDNSMEPATDYIKDLARWLLRALNWQAIMIEVIQQLLLLDSSQTMCRELGQYLGLTEPVSPNVLRRAQIDDRFAMHLVMSRGSPKLLQLHLDDPRNEKYAVDPETYQFTNLKLAGSMANAVFQWGRKGFRRLDETVVKARLEICQACPHLIEAPDKLIYKVKLGKKSDPRVCNKCGCVASSKVKIATERCPIGLWEAAT